MATEWYYAKGNQQHGPVSAADIKALAQSGQLTPQDMVRTDGMTEWKPAASVKGLFGSPTVSPPPIPQSVVAPPPVAPIVATPASQGEPSAAGRKSSAMSSFISTAKAAAQLAAKQAEKTKLTTITLPSAHRALGQESFATRKQQAEFPELFQQLDSIQNELAGIANQQAAHPAPQSFGDKAKATAGKAMQAAQSQKLSMQQASLLGSLGKAVYEKHQTTSGTHQVVDPIRDALARLSTLEAEIADLSSQGKGSWITPKRLAVGGVVAIPLVLLSVFAGGLGSKNHESTPTEPPLAVTASELYEAFRKDQAAATARYKDKWLAVADLAWDGKDIPEHFGDSLFQVGKQSSGEITYLLLNAKQSTDKNAYVACYIGNDLNAFYLRLKQSPVAPVVGKCIGTTHEATDSKKSLMAVQLVQCHFPGVTDDKLPKAQKSTAPAKKLTYDTGFAEGEALAEAHFSGSQGLEPVELRKQHLRRVIETYDDSYRGMAKIENLLSENEKAQVAHAKGIVDGYRQKLRSLGIGID